MIGYKGFNKDMTCRGFQYEVGQTYGIDGNIELCSRGFHFCKKMSDVHNYYNLQDSDHIFCEIEAIGDVKEGNDKCVTNKIKIIRQLTMQEVYELANKGKDNTGVANTGDCNTGDYNTGDCNTGNCNTGDCNTGDYNTGDCNTGNCNTGDCNTGNCNTGNYNTGNCNTGDCNTGNCNTGNYNTGNYNTGNYNTGDWNKTNRSTKVFCNEEPKMIMFNKETNMSWEEWKNTRAYDLLTYIKKSKWIWYDNMTEKEKQEHKSAKTCDGYLKEYTRKEAVKEWWKGLDSYDKKEIFNLPNFDLKVFNDIMEIRITKKEYNEVMNND